ncbi:MAG: hypothetical protein HC838_15860 [Spirulinaceae cyanobacterium RM2_2_10]|nr:hypothetical protein [Spirulinaceae cyanobacterium RM2_2_10]
MNLQTSLIGVQINRRELRLQPEQERAEFAVQVTNYSDRFASFQLEILAAGVNGNGSQRWYKVAPDVASMKPPGDTTEFQVAILQPPVPGFAGLINLTVRVFSVELGVEERQVLRLTVEPGSGAIVVTVELPEPALQAKPEESFEIPVRLHNPSKRVLTVQLVLLNLPVDWLLEPEPRSLQLLAHQWIETSISGRLPKARYAIGRDYTFTVQVTLTGGVPTQATGTLTVLPTGQLTFSIEPLEQRLPQRRPWLLHRRPESATYTLTLDNASNLPQQIRPVVRAPESTPIEFSFSPATVDLTPELDANLDLVATPRRRWFGFGRRFDFEIEVTSGLSAGDEVIVAPESGIRDGTPVSRLNGAAK